MNVSDIGFVCFVFQLCVLQPLWVLHITGPREGKEGGVEGTAKRLCLGRLLRQADATRDMLVLSASGCDT
jgi:hypothetical protein